MSITIQIDDDKHQNNTLSVLLLDEAIQILIKNGELDKEKLINAIEQAKDELLELNKDNDDDLTKMALFMNANSLQSRYLAL